MADEQDIDLEAMVKEAFPQRMITNWIIVAESITDDTKDLHITASEGITSWLAAGMLNCAQDIVITTGYVGNMGDEDEEDSDS